MNRFTVSFVVLAAAGGCLGVDRDDAYYDAPPKTMAQPWVSSQSSWRNSDGKSLQGGAINSGSSTTAYAPATTSTSRTSAAWSGSSTTTAANSSSSSKQTASKVDYNSELVRATYTTAPTAKKAKRDDRGATTATGGASTAKKSADVLPRTVEAKLPAVNLGVLRLLNSKRVTFHYEVKDPGTSGVSTLELWGTKDLRTWKKYEPVERKPGALIVEVKDEGVYGFSMVARGKGEAAKDQPPHAGEAPQVWVAVDTTKPDVRLLGAELNIMSSAPGLVIRWTAKDRNLGPRPITLLYAERAEGPWSPIAANVDNSGRYEWSMPPCVPGNVYVRVQATDLMGNAGLAQTTVLHIPGRPTASAHRKESATTEPPRLVSVPEPPTVEPMLRPVAATMICPSVSILSVDGE